MDALPVRPLPLAPDDAPRRAAAAVRRALFRRADPDPGYLVALVIAALCGDGSGVLELRAIAPGRDFPLMTLAVPESQLCEALTLMLGCCCEVPGWEIRVRGLTANTASGK